MGLQRTTADPHADIVCVNLDKRLALCGPQSPFSVKQEAEIRLSFQ